MPTGNVGYDAAFGGFDAEFDACLLQLTRMLEDAINTTRRERHPQPMERIANLFGRAMAKRAPPPPPVEQAPLTPRRRAPPAAGLCRPHAARMTRRRH